MVKLSADITKNTFYQYIKNFGFDSQTGINLIGESTGLLSKPADFSGLSKGVISFGQEIGVTALQITNAYAAVINGGNLMRPYLVKEVRDRDREIIEQNSPQVIRRVISPEVAHTLNQFMIGSVERGTGKKAQIDGITVGGKTGTAQKYNKETRRYLRGEYLASFIGFAPAEHAQYVLAIFIDSPGPLYYGGDVAAPVFARIMRRILNFGPVDSEVETSGSAPHFAELNPDMPNFSGLSITALEDYCAFRDLDYQLNGKGKYIVAQAKSSDRLEVRLGQMQIESNRMPDLTGMTIREALSKIDFSNFRVQITGNGRVKKQSVPPGLAVKKRTVLTLTCGN
jgi:membrane peptidoglycan carboxypeptidase